MNCPQQQAGPGARQTDISEVRAALAKWIPTLIEWLVHGVALPVLVVVVGMIVGFIFRL